jgi:hypothetical protein
VNVHELVQILACILDGVILFDDPKKITRYFADSPPQIFLPRSATACALCHNRLLSLKRPMTAWFGFGRYWDEIKNSRPWITLWACIYFLTTQARTCIMPVRHSISSQNEQFELELPRLASFTPGFSLA